MFYWLRASHGGVRETLDITGLLILVIPDDIWSSDVGITGYSRGQARCPRWRLLRALPRPSHVLL